ncbi:MAG: hypothetical protein ACRELE_08905 [Gemmatimonadales bacterium]
MARRSNFGHEKRQKDIKKQAKRDEKAERKRAKREAGGEDLRTRLNALFAEGWQIWERFSLEPREHDFHPFVPADYEVVLETLLPYQGSGAKFLEWGSATGVITIMADLLGLDASGIELDATLVITARGLAEKSGSDARFAGGSFLPAGYEWHSPGGDGRLATIGDGPSGYRELGHHLDEFDIVFAFPWGGEEPMMLDLMRCYGRADATLYLNTVNDGIRTYRGGRLVS